jgi:Ser/Thr protein kinase RdoA (MazF antagonist)
MDDDLPPGMDKAQFSALLNRFDIAARSAIFLGASQNFVYRVNQRGTRRIARVSTMRYRTAAEIRGELDWIGFLSGKGIPVCAPQPSASGAMCEEMIIDGRSFLLVVFEEAVGRKPGRDDLSADFCRRVGELVGQMHTASIDADATGFKVCRGEWHASRLLTSDMAETRAPAGEKFRLGVSKLMREISDIPAARSGYGMLHGDVNMGNLHIQGDRIQIFDFDNAEYGYFLQDLAVMLYDSIYSKLVTQVAAEILTPTIKTYWHALLEGYRRFNPAFCFSAKQLSDFFLLREAVIYVHYHRVIPPERWFDPFLLEMRRHVEGKYHPIGFQSLVG